MKKTRFTFVAIVLFLSQLVFGLENARAESFNCGTSGTYVVSGGVLQNSSTCIGAVVLDSSVTTINYATNFNSSVGITSLTIPATTTTISLTFPVTPGPKSLIEFIVHPDNPNYSSMDGVLYNKDKTRLISYPFGKAGSSFTIPDSVTTLSDYSITCTKNLVSVTVSSNITSMDTAFSMNSCSTSSLGAINVDAGNTNYTSIDGVLFDKSVGRLYQYPSGRTNASYTVPTGITRISNIDYNPNLASITFPSTLTTIDTYAFERSGLTTVTIPESVTSFGNYPFLGSTLLRSINVDSTNTILKSVDGILYSKDGTTLIEYPDGRLDTAFEIPSSVTTVNSQWVWGNNFLMRLTVPSSVTTMGYGFLGKQNTNGSYLVFSGNSLMNSLQGAYARKNIYCGTANSVLSSWATSASKPLLCQTEAPDYALSTSSFNLVKDTAISSYSISTVVAPDYYSISPSIVSGLSFNATTGLISGTPRTAISNQNYVVTGFNSVGSLAQSFTLTVTEPEPVYTAEELAAQKAAAERAAYEAAMEFRRQQIESAKVVVRNLISISKPVSAEQFQNAAYRTIIPKLTDLLNAEILKLPMSSRLDENIINVLIDKLNFDQSFFNEKERPDLGIYQSYGITGVTTRTLSAVNQALLELPSSLRTDLGAIQSIARKFLIVDLLSNPDTSKSVSVSQLVSIGILSSESKIRTTILIGLKKLPESRINTYEKIQAEVSILELISKSRAERLKAIKKSIQSRLNS